MKIAGSLPKAVGVLILALLLAGPAVETASQERRPSRDTGRSQGAQRVNPRDAERLERIMVPLLRATSKPRDLKEVRVGIIADSNINAANAGGGEYYVTTGLLENATDEQLTGVLAHEIAHDDLGHVARAQILGVGLNLGVVLLEQLIPGSSAVTPIAGTLVARSHSRSEELSADRHAVDILRRAGHSKAVLINALSWVTRTSGDGGGGFLSTHPATADRIDALKQLQ
jgi:predicted Zn-dependent protease